VTAVGVPPVVGSKRSPAFIAQLTFLLGIAVVLFARWGPDWPAQEYRAGLAVDNGLLAWTDQWYGGQALPGYSVLYPLFAALLGAAGTGVLATTAAAWAADRLLPRVRRGAHRAYSVAAALMLVSNLVIGQVPFLLGAAFGLGAVLALSRDRVAWAPVLAALCSLSSPLAGAFLLLSIAPLAAAYGRRRSGLLGTAIAGPLVAEVVGGAGGPFPCPWPSLLGVLAFSALAYASTSRENVVLRRFAALYALAGLACFVVPNPVGGNITRLGKLIALPLACYLLTFERRRQLAKWAVAGLAALLWPLVPLSTAIWHGADDPSQYSTYYRGLLTFLKTQDRADGRLEIPFTREHWETAHVAPHFPIARGWERQSDLQYNIVLYRPISATSYRNWLAQNAVALVALPAVPLDYGGTAEAHLLAHPPPYLVPVWHDRRWRVWRVAGARPLVSGDATATELGPASVRLRFSRAGSVVVRIRSSRLWLVTSGTACIDATPDGWLRVQSPAPGRVTIRARVSMQLVTGRPRCHGI
jgi:hypothetical protein